MFILSSCGNGTKEIKFNCSDVFEATVSKDRKSLTMEINDFKYFLFPTATANEDIFFSNEKYTLVFNEKEESLYQTILFDIYYCDKE